MDVMYPRRLDSIEHGDIREIEGASDIKVQVFGITTLYLRNGDFATFVTFGVVEKLALTVWLGKTLFE